MHAGGLKRPLAFILKQPEKLVFDCIGQLTKFEPACIA
jgi:hypothetical protein